MRLKNIYYNGLFFLKKKKECLLKWFYKLIEKLRIFVSEKDLAKNLIKLDSVLSSFVSRKEREMLRLSLIMIKGNVRIVVTPW